MKHSLSLIALLAACPAVSQETRELDAHVHGIGTLNIALDGTDMVMEFHAPGADLVGFEHAAESPAELAAVDAAIAALNAPLELFAVSEAAGCSVTSAHVDLEEGEDHEEHDHEDHAEGDHDGDHTHEEHAEHDHREDGHEDHDHEDHAEGDHDEDHAHEEHAEHDHGEDGHEDHADHGDSDSHSEFHAEYRLSCDAPDALSDISFAYFKAFPNAQKVMVQLITSSGAQAFDVDSDEPQLNLK